MNWETVKEGGLIHRLNIAFHDVRFYGKRGRFVALARVLWLTLILRHYSESCQVCGRRYTWSRWVASNEMYAWVKGNLGGTLCPRCFTTMAWDKGIRLVWTPVLETPGVHGNIMDGQSLKGAGE